MAADKYPPDETPEAAAESIASALDFLRREAEAAGLGELGELIRQASAEARDRQTLPANNPPRRSMDLPAACRAIVGLPAEYREALIFKKIYRRSCAQIAEDCSVSVATAKDRVFEGFRLLRASLRSNPA